MLDDSTGPTLLTYQEAATQVGKPVRTINRWRAGGMPMTTGVRDGQRVRLVDEGVLLGWWRDRMHADPVHQLRMHAIAVEEAREYGLPEPARPVAKRNRSPRPENPVTVDEEGTAQSERSVEWDSVGTLRRGADEWAALSIALVKVDPACHRDPNYIADRWTLSGRIRWRARVLRVPSSSCAARSPKCHDRPPVSGLVSSGRVRRKSAKVPQLPYSPPHETRLKPAEIRGYSAPLDRPFSVQHFELYYDV